MRLAALVLTLALGSMVGNGTAKAFDCNGVTLPSSIVICSDPELMRLTDERQEAINEARERIDEEAWAILWDNQQAWVRSYAPACGIPQDRPPPMPVPASIRACFKRAAEARIAFIRGYGLTASGIPSPRIGPGFDCSKAVRPLALLICADADLSRVDLRYNQAFWALLQQLDPSARRGAAARGRSLHRCGPGPVRDAPLGWIDNAGLAGSRLRKGCVRRTTEPVAITHLGAGLRGSYAASRAAPGVATRPCGPRLLLR